MSPEITVAAISLAGTLVGTWGGIMTSNRLTGYRIQQLESKKELGTKESPPNSNNVKYNTWFYGHEVSGSAYPWCCAFISWLFKAEQGLCKKTASCENLLSWFESRGQIVKTPQAGDIVFFKYSTNSRRTNHVGLVVSASGNTINTIEGNTSTTSQDVEKHNQIVEKVFRLEDNCVLLDEKIKVANNRISDLERHEEKHNDR